MSRFRTSASFVYSLFLVIVTAALLAGCGGGGASSGGVSNNGTPTPAQVAAITPAQIATYSDEQIIALDVNIKFLSDASLNALSQMKNLNYNLNGQIESITQNQILALSPAQVRMIGAASGGMVSTSKIQYLNPNTWAALGSDSAQVAAITPAEIATLWDSEIIALGTNINSLSDAALNALSPMKNLSVNLNGQIQSIYQAQIAALSPAQVRMIGASEGGMPATSKIQYLSPAAWAIILLRWRQSHPLK